MLPCASTSQYKLLEVLAYRVIHELWCLSRIFTCGGDGHFRRRLWLSLVRVLFGSAQFRVVRVLRDYGDPVQQRDERLLLPERREHIRPVGTHAQQDDPWEAASLVYVPLLYRLQRSLPGRSVGHWWWTHHFRHCTGLKQRVRIIKWGVRQHLCVRRRSRRNAAFLFACVHFLSNRGLFLSSDQEA